MNDTLRVVQILGENVSYQAKGASIQNLLCDLGFENGGMKTREEVIANPETIKDAIVVLADAYHLHENEALNETLKHSVVLAAPSVLREEEAKHADSIGATVLLPASQQKGFEELIAKGTIAVVKTIPAQPVAGALAQLKAESNGQQAVDAMLNIARRCMRYTFFYPPGHFSAETKGEKEFLTENDILKMEEFIEQRGKKGILVVCGGRVDADVVARLRDRFAGKDQIAILSQNEHKADLPSAYLELVREETTMPSSVVIDALARTTLEVLIESGKLQGPFGQSLCYGVATSEKMGKIPRRTQQVRDYIRTYNVQRVLELGQPWRDLFGNFPSAIASAPDIKTVLKEWATARHLLSAMRSQWGGPSRMPSSQAKHEKN